jgi:flavin reductase (DIM6/NTAB) family NADH-FMN oxidoreductase RutF
MLASVDQHRDPSTRLDFRDVVGAFATGVTVVTARFGQSQAGMTLNSFTSVSLDPLLVLVSLAHGTRTLEKVLQSKQFAVNILHRRQADVALAFAQRGTPFPEGHTVVDPAGFDVRDVTSAGDHDLVIGEVIDFEGSGGEPLIFHRGAFGGLDEDALVPRGRVIGIAGGW